MSVERPSNFNPRMAAEANVTGRKPDGTPWITAGNYPVIARLQAEEAADKSRNRRFKRKSV